MYTRARVVRVLVIVAAHVVRVDEVTVRPREVRKRQPRVLGHAVVFTVTIRTARSSREAGYRAADLRAVPVVVVRLVESAVLHHDPAVHGELSSGAKVAVASVRTRVS